MAIVDLIMPKMGESITEATVLKWHKQPGDIVKMDETILDIATDKVDSEVPSTAAGVMTEICYRVNDVVPVGSVIARIDTAANNKPSVTQVYENTKPAAILPETPVVVAVPAAQEPVAGGARFYSPLVLNIAAKEGVSMSELERIQGTGNEGRVTKKDIIDYVNNKGVVAQPSSPAASVTSALPVEPSVSVTAPAPAVSAPTTKSTPSPTIATGNVEIVEMDRMRKMIAEHMVRSKATSPHVTSFTEADVTNLVTWRDREKGAFEKKYGEKITFTPLFFEAIATCIRRFPFVNCSLDGDKIIIKKDINLGMATALPSGNLIVPVIRNADTKNLFGLSKEVNALANAARANKLKPEDTQGGTFTVTNVGTFGSLMGTPIINQPQVAILALGAIKKRPMVMETPEGDVIAIRHMMYLSLSYDHRIVDGSVGASFLTAVANELEAFDASRKI